MTSLQILEADMGYEQWYLGNKDAFSTSSRKGMRGGTKIWDIYTHSWILAQFTTCHQAFLQKWYFNTKILNFWDIFSQTSPDFPDFLISLSCPLQLLLWIDMSTVSQNYENMCWWQKTCMLKWNGILL